MIDRAHDLPITRQAEALNISRGSVYYLPRLVPKADLAIMQRLDRLHLEFPFAGSRMLRGLLVAEGCKIGRRHVKTLMRRMGMRGAVSPSAARRSPSRDTRSIRICCAASRSHGQTRCGRWTSPTSRWRAASSIWLSCSTGSAVACCRGAYRSRWRRHSASRRLRTRSPASWHAGDLQHRSRQPVHRRGVHRRADQKQDRRQHGRQERLAGQRVRRAAVAQR